MNAEGLLAGASALNRPAEEYHNDANVEEMWVVKACEYADVHFSLISSADPSLLKLTKDDDRIYTLYLQSFPQLQTAVLKEEQLKSVQAKEKWRAFCEQLKDVEDYSFGTLLRLNCRGDYSEDNTILVTRIQFLAIEIDRNQRGLNNYIWNLKSATAQANRNNHSKS